MASVRRSLPGTPAGAAAATSCTPATLGGGRGQLAGAGQHRGHPAPFQLLLHHLQPLDQRGHPVRHLGAGHLERLGHRVQQRPLVWPGSRSASNPTKASTRRTPAPTEASPISGDRADLGGVLDVGATAQLARPRHRRSRPPGPRRRRSRRTAPARRSRGPAASGMYRTSTGRSARSARLATSSMSRRVAGCSAGAPGEVQPQVAGPVVGAALQRGRAEHLAQRGVHHVGAGVRLPGRPPPFRIDLGLDRLTGAELALEHLDPVHDQPLDRLLHVQHPQPAAGRRR